MGQCPIYKKPHVIQKPGDLAPLIWYDFLTHDLDQVMRQKDIDFATALNNIQKRVPEKNSLEDLMLQSHELSIPHIHQDYPVNTMHVYAQNQYCSEWNSIHLNTLNGELYFDKAFDVAKDNNTNLANIPFPTNPKKQAI